MNQGYVLTPLSVTRTRLRSPGNVPTLPALSGGPCRSGRIEQRRFAIITATPITVRYESDLMKTRSPFRASALCLATALAVLLPAMQGAAQQTESLALLASRINAALEEEKRHTERPEVKQNFVLRTDLSFELDEYNRSTSRRSTHITGNICEIKRIDVQTARARDNVWNVHVEAPLKQVFHPDQMERSQSSIAKRTLFIFNGDGNQQRARTVGESLEKLRSYCP